MEAVLNQIAYLTNRARRHERLMALVRLSLDRAAVSPLRQPAASESPRLPASR